MLRMAEQVGDKFEGFAKGVVKHIGGEGGGLALKKL